MFYAQNILTKKGPLAKIWLAAHMQNKLTKAMVYSTDVDQSCEKIIQPEAPLALRLSSNLMLGVVRIYSRKAKYLLSDCSEAMAKLKVAFKPGLAQLADDATVAPYASITLTAADARAAPVRISLAGGALSPGMALSQSASGVDMELEFGEFLEQESQALVRTHSRSQTSFRASPQDITMVDHHDSDIMLSQHGGAYSALGSAGVLNSDGFGSSMQFGFDPDENEPLDFVPSQRATDSSASSVARVETPEALRRDSEAGIVQRTPEPALTFQDSEGGSSPKAGNQLDVAQVTMPAFETDDSAIAFDSSPAAARSLTPDRDANIDIGGAADLSVRTPPVQLTPERGASARSKRRRLPDYDGVDGFGTEIPAKQIRAQLLQTEDIVLADDVLMASSGVAAHYKIAPDALMQPILPAQRARMRTQGQGSHHWREDRDAADDALGNFAMDCIAHALKRSSAKRSRTEAASVHIEEEGQLEVPRHEDNFEEQLEVPRHDDNLEEQLRTPDLAIDAPSQGEAIVPLTVSPPHDALQMSGADAVLPADVSVHEASQRAASSDGFDFEAAAMSSLAGRASSASASADVTLFEVAATRANLEDEDPNDAKLNARSVKMCMWLRDRLDDSESRTQSSDHAVKFLAASQSASTGERLNKRTMARCFYELLNLSTRNVIQVQQQGAYGEISVRPSDRFAAALSSIS